MKQVQLETSKIVLQVNLSGGAYFDIHLNDNPLNPINWKTVNPEEPPFMGHFLCLDRWGPPSEDEKANGIRHHGEVTSEDWELQEQFPKGKNNSGCKMNCRLPMAGLQVTRKIEFSENEPVFRVTFGIEFGTTGLHEPFPVVAKKGKIFDQNIYDFIDAGEITSKSFTSFLSYIPNDYQGVEKIEIKDTFFAVIEKGL